MEPKKVTLSIRLDPEIHSALRDLAYQRRRSINSIVLAAIVWALSEAHILEEMQEPGE